MAKTRGQLEPAKIYDLGKTITVDCMFNPFEYKISKSITYNELPKNQASTPQAELWKGGPQTLVLDLFFDEYESGKDVTITTNKLWKLMDSNTTKKGSTSKKISPPEVAFEWGVFKFQAFITNMVQTFILFKTDGTPVRAKVNVTFSQYTDVNDYPNQNPTSGGGDIERVWCVRAGDRLDAIAYEVYGETDRWRLIAERNKIRDPLALRPGQMLVIPALGV